MNRLQRLTVILILVAILVAIPTSALANKKLYLARLSTGAELHEVVGSNASGSAAFSSWVDGSLRFQMRVINLSGPVTGVHIHGPADATQNAPVILSLCGNPGPAVLVTCTTNDGVMEISGTITSVNLAQWGITGRQLVEWMDGGLTYVNVHTALNPAGEVRGQLSLR